VLSAADSKFAGWGWFERLALASSQHSCWAGVVQTLKAGFAQMSKAAQALAMVYLELTERVAHACWNGWLEQQAVH